MDTHVLAKAHSGIAILVLLIYLARGLMMVAGSKKTNSVALTSITHTLTLVFIVLGIYTAYKQGLPFTSGFVLSKITLVLLFIVLGSVALKSGLGKGIAIALWLLGLAAFAYAALLGTHILSPLF